MSHSLLQSPPSILCPAVSVPSCPLSHHMSLRNLKACEQQLKQHDQLTTVHTHMHTERQTEENWTGETYVFDIFGHQEQKTEQDGEKEFVDNTMSWTLSVRKMLIEGSEGSFVLCMLEVRYSCPDELMIRSLVPRQSSCLT